MSETITTYLLPDGKTEAPMGRLAFYAEQIALAQTNQKPTKAVGVVAVFLFNPRGEIFIQKRSYNKAHNPGLLDKSIGGHVPAGDTPHYTTMVETIQELQTPSVVLKDQTDFLKTFELLREYLSTVAILRYIKTEISIVPKIIQNKEIDIASKASIYFGVYDGRIRPVDRETRGVLWYTLSELTAEMAKTPATFAPDLHYYLAHFRSEMENFIESIKQ